MRSNSKSTFFQTECQKLIERAILYSNVMLCSVDVLLSTKREARNYARKQHYPSCYEQRNSGSNYPLTHAGRPNSGSIKEYELCLVILLVALDN